MENKPTKGIDYVEILKFFRQHPDKRIALANILGVKNSFIPAILYKYSSLTDDVVLNDTKLDTLKKKQVYMSLSAELNDPFDNKGYFYNPERLLSFERLQHCNGRLIDDFSTFSRTASFTSLGINSMPMWAHYGANHQGFCVSYDMDAEANAQLKSCTFPVQYVEKRIDITDLMVEQTKKICEAINTSAEKGEKTILLEDLSLPMLSAFFANLKHISWAYEQEYRCTVGSLNDENRYTPATPKEIYIGSKCNPTYANKLIDIAKTIAVPIYLMSFDEQASEYSLNAKLITA